MGPRADKSRRHVTKRLVTWPIGGGPSAGGPADYNHGYVLIEGPRLCAYRGAKAMC